MEIKEFNQDKKEKTITLKNLLKKPKGMEEEEDLEEEVDIIKADIKVDMEKIDNKMNTRKEEEVTIEVVIEGQEEEEAVVEEDITVEKLNKFTDQKIQDMRVKEKK